MRRIAIAVSVVMAIGVTSSAEASVLISAPSPRVKDCGEATQTGVWNRDDGNATARSVLIRIKTIQGRTVFRKRVTATGSWRYWNWRPGRCGRRFVVSYTNADFGTAKFRIRYRDN